MGKAADEVTTQAEVARERAAEQALWTDARTDPLDFFSNRAQWPKHISVEEARTRTFFWGHGLHMHGTYGQAARDVGERGAQQYPHEWPLPVGQQALRDRAGDIRRRGTAGYHGDPMVLHDAMPFAGDELAAWVLDTRIGRTRVECFGLVRLDESSSADDEVYAIDRMAFRISADGVPPPAVQQLCANVHSWWDSIAGRQLHRGRPPGTTIRSFDTYQAAYRDVEVRLGRRPRSQQEFCANASIPIDTMKRNLGEWGITWSTFKDECSAL